MQDVKPLDRAHKHTKADKLSCYQGMFTNAVSQTPLTPSPPSPARSANLATFPPCPPSQLSFGHHNIEQQLLTDPLPRGWSFDAHVMFDLEAHGRIDRTKEVAAETNMTLARNILEEEVDGSAGLLCHSNIWDLRQAGGGMWTGPKGGMSDLLISERRGIRPEWFKWGHYIDVSWQWSTSFVAGLALISHWFFSSLLRQCGISRRSQSGVHLASARASPAQTSSQSTFAAATSSYVTSTPSPASLI